MGLGSGYTDTFPTKVVNVKRHGYNLRKGLIRILTYVPNAEQPWISFDNAIAKSLSYSF